LPFARQQKVRDKPCNGRETVSHDPKDGLSFQIARYLFKIGGYVFQKVGYVLLDSSWWPMRYLSLVNNA